MRMSQICKTFKKKCVAFADACGWLSGVDAGIIKRYKHGGEGMLLCFVLSMPGKGSWDGKWSSEDKYYAIVKNFGRGKKNKERAENVLKKNYHRYDFGDGWAAGITIKQVTAKEANLIRKRTSGFCGYDWMIDSILKVGEINPDI